MESKNCAKCGRLYSSFGSPICNSCKAEEEETFLKVKEYIDENPSNDLKTIECETGVSARKILKYIKDGRIVITKGISGEVKCDQCGKPISSGRYCDRCVLKIQAVAEELKVKKTPTIKMHSRN